MGGIDDKETPQLGSTVAHDDATNEEDTQIQLDPKITIKEHLEKDKISNPPSHGFHYFLFMWPTMATNLIFFFSTILASLTYSYYIPPHLSTPTFKLISLTPIFYLFITLPLHLSSVLATAVAAFSFTWLANFKLALFAFDHPPLHPPISLTQFIAIASLPAKIKSNHSFKVHNMRVLIESLAFPLLIGLIEKHKHYLSTNTNVVLVIYCFLVFILIDLLVFVSSAVVWMVVGVELDPPSDEPYLATSLQDFWGRRWNLMVTSILRHTVYKPVKLMFYGKKWDFAVAVLATFLVSGLMHELLFYYVARVSPTWEMTSFFVLHGVCLVVELLVKRALAEKVEFPVVVSRLLTVGFVVVTSFWLFFPPLIESGVDVKVLEEFKVFGEYVKTMFGL